VAGRILYLVGRYPSLSESFVEREVLGLRALGMDVDVFPLLSFDPFRALHAALCEPAAAALVRQVMHRPATASGAAWSGLWARALSALPAARRASHIHGHFLGFPAVVAQGIARALDLPYSLTGHARDVYVELTPETVIAGAAFRCTCTESARQYLLARYPEWPFRLIRHGKTLEKITPLRVDGPPRILAVGRCVEKKGFRYLIDACAYLNREGFEHRCTIVGDGPLLSALCAQAAWHGLDGCLKFTGALSRQAVSEQYRSADVLAVPSVVAGDGDRDGVPNVVLEAMAHGLPVVATDAGAIPEAVVSESTGLLVPQGDAVALAAALQHVCTDATLRQRLGEEGRRHLEEVFDPDRWLEELRSLFDGVR
jgi:glycosyltransferase involved in cell wall biosynthesis